MFCHTRKASRPIRSQRATAPAPNSRRSTRSGYLAAKAMAMKLPMDPP